MYLLERGLARVVDVDDRHVSQEAVRQRLPARIGRRVASAYELNPLQRHPGLVTRSEEAAMLHQLTQERDDSLRPVLVHVRQVDLVAEQHQPFAQLLERCCDINNLSNILPKVGVDGIGFSF